MRLLYCLSNMGAGGAQRQTCYLANEMAARGHEVRLALMSGGPNLSVLDPHRVPISWLTGAHKPASTRLANYNPCSIMALSRLIRTFRPNVVQSGISQMDVVCGMAIRISPAPWILREPGSSWAYIPRILRNLRLWAATRAAGVVANCHAGARLWEPHLRAGSVAVIPNGVPCSAIASGPKARLARWDMPEDAELVLSVGRLETYKNTLTLIRACAELFPRRPKLRLLICGDGSEKAALRREIAAEGLLGRIVLAGHQPDPYPLLRRADVFLSLSRTEGMPNSVLEAFAAGCPAILSDIPEHRALLDDPSLRYLHADGHSDIGAAIQSVLENRDDEWKAAQRRAQSVRRYSTSAMADRYQALYQGLTRADR